MGLKGRECRNNEPRNLVYLGAEDGPIAKLSILISKRKAAHYKNAPNGQLVGEMRYLNLDTQQVGRDR